MRWDQIIALQKAIDKLGTPIEMRVSIMLGITKGIDGQEIPHDKIPAVGSTKWSKDLLQAIHEQDQMGWDKMVRGFISAKWTLSMEEYLRETGQLSETKCGAIWGTKIINLLHTYCLNLWEVRNSFIHGGKTKNKRLLQRDLLAHKVRTQYQRYRGHLPWKYRSLFYLPIDMRLKHGVTQIELWLQRTTIILNKYDKEKGLQTNLTGWIQRGPHRRDNVTEDTWNLSDTHILIPNI